jgi:ABC-2 type transport system ATP-binding protein
MPVLHDDRVRRMTAVVEARGLRKRFGEVEALAGLDLVAESGQVTALLGPNGAGKTTFISAVATLVRPDSGQLYVAGIDAWSEPGRVRRMIGLAGQSASVEPAMTGRENLDFIARLFGLDRRQARAAASAVLERLDLVDAADRLVRTYSGGIRRRLDLGASLVGNPKLLLLDEPTAGLDPRGRLELWSAIRNLVSDGTDVLLTTQYLEEADQLARHVVIIDHGRAIAAGAPGDLKRRVGRDVLEVRPRQPSYVPAVEEVLGLVTAEPVRADLDTGTVSVTADRGAEQLTEALRLLVERQIAVDDIGLRRPSLDEAFLALTGRDSELEAQENAPAALDAA